ncbi:PilZ domain-containing protein [Desulfonatronum thiodismutans]|uniref:hypothetical protein n=1 Tax=Desulfonatronum thiodismutans TaxID=159290 RepID=UPI001268A03B|nr:hypothetical protein [Desulfonatronum thiodismutans]
MTSALSITNLSTIQSLLGDAQDLRAKLIISPDREHGGRLDVTGVLREIGVNDLIIEISGQSANPAWVGHKVICYFKARDHVRKTDIFYNFTSPVLDVAGSSSNSILVLEKPSVLDIGQRRSNIRLDPATGDILNFSLWEEGKMVFRCPKADRAKLRPPIVGGQHFEQGLVIVQDVSAGGLRIRLTAKLLKDISNETLSENRGAAAEGKSESPAAWAKGDRLVIWLVLSEQADSGHQVVWLKGRITYGRKDYLNKDMEIGVEFTHHGKNDPSGKIVWNPVRENDIQELGAWVYQRYLERFRRGIV